jgi:nucleotidyltransferase/DNA polymerase involved in DNA repair
MSDALGVGELSLARFTSDRFASWLMRVVEGETSAEISALRSRKSISKEHTFSQDQRDIEVVLERLGELVTKVLKRAKNMGVSGRLAEVKIRYRGFETHSHQRALTVAMDEESVFQRSALRLFAEQVEYDRPIRLIGFKMGNLEVHDSRQITLDLEEE